MNILELYKIYKQHPIVCTDTRNIIKDSIFFALKGESFNANTFSEKALEEGCSYAIIDEKKYKTSNKHILVDNVLETLQELAKYHRKQLNIPLIGITGTNGKTTTKELIRCILETKFKTYATKGNLNNHIGVPLSILAIDNTIEIAIIEMGANHPHEIENLCTISQPTHGIITNIGKAHLEGFGDFPTLIKTKQELYNYIKENKGLLFVNNDNELLSTLSENIEKYTYGTNNSDSKGEYTQASPYLVFELLSKKGRLYVKSKIIGSYNFENALAASTIGRYFNIDDLKIKEALELYKPSNNRSQLLKTPNNILILDSYNANPTSMSAAINNFLNIEANNKTVILGDMLELGKESPKEHKLIVEMLKNKNIKNTFLIGNEFSKQELPSNFKSLKTTKELINYLKEIKIKQNTILIKGSRGIKLEQCIDFL